MHTPSKERAVLTSMLPALPKDAFYHAYTTWRPGVGMPTLAIDGYRVHLHQLHIEYLGAASGAPVNQIRLRKYLDSLCRTL